MSAVTVETITPAPRVFHERRDMPAGLTTGERSAYVRGYSRGCLTYVRKYGGPGVVHDGPAPAAGTPARRALGRELSRLARAHEEERHPAAHRAGLAALKKYRKVHGIAEPAPVRAPRAVRKPAAVAPVVDVAPVVAPAPKLRKRSKLTPCGRHAARFGSMSLRESVRWCLEGGPGSACADGTCELLAGTDYVTAEMCTGPYPLTWTEAPDETPADENPAAPVDVAPDNSADATAARRAMFSSLGWSTTAPVDVDETPAPVGEIVVLHVVAPAPDDDAPAPVHAGYTRRDGAATLTGPACRGGELAAGELDPVFDDAPATCPACVDILERAAAYVAPDETPDETPAPAPVDMLEAPRNTRRAARRKLAEDMRARGEDPRDASAWAAAKLAAGVK